MKSFSFKDIKDVYDKADKNFNPKKKGLDNSKEVNPQAFTSKIYFKFLAMSSKTINKAMKSNNLDYYKIIEETNGDYSRRRGGDIAAQIKNHVDWSNDIIGKRPSTRYSILGVFSDVYAILSDMKWRAAFKLAFEYCKKNGDTKTIISAIKNLYFGMVVSCETTLLKVIELEYDISLGKDVEEALLQLQTKYYTFMKKNIIPTINLYTLMKNINDPIQYVKNIITGESKAKKATENFTVPMYKDEHTLSVEGRMWDTIKHSAGAITNLIASSGTAALGTTAAVVGGTSLTIGGVAAFPITVIIAAIGSLWFIFTLLPSIRIIIYYAMISKTNIQKELKLNEEMLRNNIAELQAKYDSMRDGPEKEKLGEIIEKQKKYYEEILGKIEDDNRNSYNDDVTVDNELDRDDADSDKEAEQAAGEAGDDSSDDDFNVMI